MFYYLLAVAWGASIMWLYMYWFKYKPVCKAFENFTKSVVKDKGIAIESVKIHVK